MAPRRSLRAPLFRATGDAKTDAPSATYVLLHGVGLSHRSFSRLARELITSGTVMALDLPGFGVGGRRSRPKGSVSVEQYGALVVEELLRVRPGPTAGHPVILVGHSMGVQVALESARQGGDVVDGLVFIGAVVDPRHRTLFAQAVQLTRDFAFEPLLTSAMAVRDYLCCGPRWYVTEALRMLSYPTQEKIRAYEGPLLVLRGEHDPIAAEEWSVHLAAQVPGATFGEILGGRHNVVHSNPAGTAAHIAAFARSVTATS